jgi:hypothetical protein
MGVMGERSTRAPVAFGAEHFGPFGKRQKIEVLRDMRFLTASEVTTPTADKVG